VSANSEIITSALRALRIVAEGESATAAQAADALVVLNQMMESWSVGETALHYFAQTDVSGECPIPQWAERGVIAMLAIELAADYGAEITPALVKRAEDGYGVILRESIKAAMKPADMSHLGGQHCI